MTILMRRLLICLAVLSLIPVAAQALLVQQRDQIGVTIIVNVTAPLAMSAPAVDPRGAMVIGSLAMEGLGARTGYRAENLNFTPTHMLLAQVHQRAVKVEAEVSPNPLATLLYSDQNAVTVNATSGQSIKVPCAYHVTVDTTQNSWQLKDGLATDFDGSIFPGADVGRDNYLSTPHPTSSPFAVYADNGGYWTLLDANGQKKTYCVDLTVTVPAGVPAGSYSSNAIYTVYY